MKERVGWSLQSHFLYEANRGTSQRKTTELINIRVLQSLVYGLKMKGEGNSTARLELSCLGNLVAICLILISPEVRKT